jgi:thioredoxin-like negative regulator of GroEL
MGLVTLDIINTDNNPAAVEQWSVTTLPTYVVFYEGRELHRSNQAEITRRYIVSLYK